MSQPDDIALTWMLVKELAEHYTRDQILAMDHLDEATRDLAVEYQYRRALAVAAIA